MTDPTPPDSRRTRTLIICGTLLMLAVLSLYAWQALHHQDTTQTLTLVGTIAVAAFGASATYNRTERVERKVDQVQQQTNGNTGELLSLLREAQHHLATCHPPTPPPAPTPPLPSDVRVDPPAGPTAAP